MVIETNQLNSETIEETETPIMTEAEVKDRLTLLMQATEKDREECSSAQFTALVQEMNTIFPWVAYSYTDLHELAADVYGKLIAYCLTSDEVYQIASVDMGEALKQYSQKLTLLQAAASLGNMKACLDLATQVELGVFAEDDGEQKTWATECFQYFKKELLETLKTTDPEYAKDVASTLDLIEGGYYRDTRPRSGQKFTVKQPAKELITNALNNNASAKPAEKTQTSGNPLNKEISNTLPETNRPIPTPPTTPPTTPPQNRKPSNDNPQTPITNKSQADKLSAYDDVMAKLNTYERFLAKYPPSQNNHNDAFIANAKKICDAKKATFKSGDNDLKSYMTQKNVLCEALMKEAHSHFKHQDMKKRILADMVFIPLGVLSLGTLFGVKKLLTGDCTFFWASTKRQSKLQEELQSVKPQVGPK